MKKLSLALTLVALTVFAIGCSTDTSTSANNNGETQKTGDGHDDHEGHDHGASDHTPSHGGHLIELGRNHEYHAELVDDHKTESITVYIMDGHLKPLTIPESAISLVLTAGDETKTFELMAIQPGGSAEFASSDEAMMGMMETDGVTGKLRVKINGKPFLGAFDHEGHGHEGHEEGGDDHKGHNH